MRSHGRNSLKSFNDCFRCRFDKFASAIHIAQVDLALKRRLKRVERHRAPTMQSHDESKEEADAENEGHAGASAPSSTA